jgi:hypothetical protein
MKPAAMAIRSPHPNPLPEGEGVSMKRFPHMPQPNGASLLLPHLSQPNGASLLLPHLSQPNGASLLLPHLLQLNGASLLPPGEGQDEGINETGSLGDSIPSPRPSHGGRGGLWDSSDQISFVDFVAIHGLSFVCAPRGQGFS